MKKVKCIHPFCKNMVDPLTRQHNVMGVTEYCSRECYSTWNPALRAVAVKMGVSNPVHLFHALRTSIANVGMRTTAVVLVTTTRQLKRWLERLPGVMPEGYNEQGLPAEVHKEDLIQE